MAAENKGVIESNGVKVTDGLVCRGIVASSVVKDKNWDGKSYRELVAMISDGENSFQYKATDKNGSIPVVVAFQRAEVIVEYTKTEKGLITIHGEIKQLG